MNKQDFEKDYDNYTRDLDSEDIKTPVSESRQTFRKKKKIILAAASIVLAGAVAASVFGLKGCSKDGVANTPLESTSIDDGEDLSEYEYVLVEDLAASDDNQIKQVAQDIKNNSGTELSLDDVENMLKYYNGNISRDDFSSDATDVDIYEKIITYINEAYNIMFEGIDEYSKQKESITSIKENGETPESKRPYEELVVSASAILDSSSYSRQYQMNLASILENTLEDIHKGNTSNFDEYADEYYKIFETVQNDDSIPSNEATILNKELKAIYPIYADNLSKDKQDYINKQNQAFDDNKWLFDVLDENLDINYEEVVEEADKDGDFGYDLTPLTERYNSSDSADANANAGKTGEEDVTEKVQTGGQKVSGSGSHETVSEATTSRPVVSTTIVNVPDKETTTKKVTGGDPVGPTETQTETTTKLGEEVVPPGTEPSVEDVRPTDDGIPIYSEDEWEKEQGKSSNSMALGAGVATLAVLSGAAGSLKVLRSRNNYKDSDSLTNDKGTSKKKKRK